MPSVYGGASVYFEGIILFGKHVMVPGSASVRTDTAQALIVQRWQQCRIHLCFKSKSQTQEYITDT